MNAAVLTKYGNFEWKKVNDPVIGKSQVLVKITYASICGSDQHIFKGDFHPRTKLPFIPGHEFGGVVVEAGEAVTSYQIGDRVAVDPIIWCGTCAACQTGHHTACVNLRLLGVDQDGGFGEYVAAGENQLYKIDDAIPDQHVSLIELYAIGFHANNRAETKRDDIIAIWGTGKVGHSIFQAARTRTENTIFLVDIIGERLDIASKNYSNVQVINAKEVDPVKLIMDKTEGRGVDIAFEAVGHHTHIEYRPNPVQGCIQSIRGAGTVCVLGLSGEPVDVNFKELIWREGRIISSRNSHGEFAESVKYMSNAQLQPDVLISDVFAARDAQLAFEALESHPEKYLKVLLKMAE